MTAFYDCTVDLSEYDLTDKEIAALDSELDAAGYDLYRDDDEGIIAIQGEREVGDYLTPRDIERRINLILWRTVEIDAQIKVYTFED